MRNVAVTLVEELRAAGRITTVEAEVLRRGLSFAQARIDVDDWLVPPSFDAGALRTWVRRVCEKMNLRPTTLEREAGIGPSTLTKFLARADDASIGSSTINAIVMACRNRHSLMAAESSAQ